MPIATSSPRPSLTASLLEIDLLTLKRKLAIEIVKLIVFTQEGARKQMAALHPQTKPERTDRLGT